MASRGIASRRQAEAMIRAGRVIVDGATVTQLGTKVDPRTAEIRVDGRTLRPQAMRYIVLNKPRGYITTTDDERDRQTVMDLVPVRERLYPVGRLDRDTEGLLLLTNDGEVANRVMHPRYGLAKEYTVLTSVKPPEAVLAKVRQGIVVEGRAIVPEEFRIFRETRDGVLLTITVHEGLNRLVRRIMDAAGIQVTRLRRVRIGPLDLGNIPVGDFRDLSPGELASLLQAVRLDREEAERAARPVTRGGPLRSPAKGSSPRPKAGTRRPPPGAPRQTGSRGSVEPGPKESGGGTGPTVPRHGRSGSGRPPQPRSPRSSGDHGRSSDGPLERKPTDSRKRGRP